MSDLLPITLQEEIAEVEREIALRKAVYPKFVASGRLKQHKGDRQIAAMTAVATRLTKLDTRGNELHRLLTQAMMQLQDGLNEEALATVRDAIALMRQP